MKGVSKKNHVILQEQGEANTFSKIFSRREYDSFVEAQSKLENLANKIQPKIDSSGKVLRQEMNWMYNMKLTGVILVMQEALNSLKIMSCSLAHSSQHVQVPHNLFSWNIDHFMERANLSNIKYLYEFVSTHRHNLDLIKVKVDVDAIIGILEAFVYDILNDTKQKEKKLRGVYELIHLQGNRLDKKQSGTTLKALECKLHNYDKIKQKESEDLLKWIKKYRDKFYSREIVKYPVELRYVKNYEKARNVQLAKKLEIENNVYTSEITDCRIKYSREEEVFNNVCSAYETLTDRLKVQIDEKMEKYEAEYDRLDMQKSRILGELDEAVASLKRHQEKYKYYQSEIAKHFANEQAKEAERAWRAGLQESAVQEDAVDKSKKKKGKGKKAKEKKESKPEKPEKETAKGKPVKDKP